MTNKLILNYLGDAVLYSRDLALLDCQTSWLNSDIIHFHFLRLQNEPSLVLGSGTKNAAADDGCIDCLFLDPTIVSFIMYQLDESDQDEVSNLTSAWNLSSTNDVEEQNVKRIFVPINDEHKSSHMSYASGQHASGSHWSLLVIDIITAASSRNETQPKILFYSFDSHHGYNIFAAKAVANKMYSVLQQHYISMPKDRTSIVNVTECQALQQNNGYDCGIYTLGHAEALLRFSNGTSGRNNKGLLDEKAIETAFASYFNDMGGPVNFASNMRKRIGDDIRKLALEYQKSH